MHDLYQCSTFVGRWLKGDSYVYASAYSERWAWVMSRRIGPLHHCPEFQGWIKTSKDSHLLAFKPCGLPPPWAWAGPSDLLLINKVGRKRWDVPAKIRLKKTHSLTSLLWRSPLPFSELPCGETHLARKWCFWPTASKDLGLPTAKKISLEVNPPPVEPWDDCRLTRDLMSGPPS